MSKGFDELGNIAKDVFGSLSSAGKEVEGVMKDKLERLILQLDLIPRDEYESLKARVASLEAELAALKSAKKPAAKKAAPKKAAKKPAAKKK